MPEIPSPFVRDAVGSHANGEFRHCVRVAIGLEDAEAHLGGVGARHHGATRRFKGAHGSASLRRIVGRFVVGRRYQQGRIQPKGFTERLFSTRMKHIENNTTKDKTPQ